MSDRAKVVTTAVIRIVRDHLPRGRTPPLDFFEHLRSIEAGLAEAHAPIEAYLRGEFCDIERHVYDEVRERDD